MLTKELYTKGSRVWVPHPELVWEGAEVLEDYQSGILRVRTEDGKVKDFSVPSDNDLPPLRNPDILIGENDLTSLSYLHEPAVLYNLQVRFCHRQAIYTYCGIVLVAINPYSDLPIYDIDTIWAYRGQAMGDLEPHIFAVAEEAFTKMEREQRDQSIIVSGESGAGKTVSAKYAMRYFATVGGSTTETHVEKKVLASSPIMEAIGNAKTTRNDNSSRFGKYIELQFSRNYNIIGASMRTYLLEKSRVVFQAPDERNYHIFYQLCKARNRYPHLKLSDASSYEYLNQESVIQGIDDSEAFQDTYSALLTLGFVENDMDDIFKILAAVLHLGNIKIIEQSGAHGDNENSYISEKDPHLSVLAELLQLNIKDLRTWLCHRRIVSMRETFDKPMTKQEAVGARDALAKHIYAELFAYIVSVINTNLEKASENRHKFIGVLDIYGFETFETNSFEQFCINYANEKLQQQFNQHVFKLEQEEYLKEEIEWKFIDFYDNQPCIDLIEAKLGILDLLDEECRMPKGSDNSWAEKLYIKCSKWNHFAKPRFGTNSFVVNHFADKVEYDVAGFLEKNRDTVIEEQVAVVRNGGNLLVQKLFVDPEKERKLAVPSTMPRVKVSAAPLKSSSATVGATSKHKKSVGSQFRDSLNALMATLNATTPHYIRCIKPNDDKQAFEYNSPRAVQQLRACGVLETIRISAAGFPSRWLYVDFFNRYRVLCHSNDIRRDDLKRTCEAILGDVVKDNDKYKFGKTKIFFRAGQVAYLERLRAEKLKQCCLLIQKTVRGFLQKQRYRRVRNAIKCIQRHVRGYIARRYVDNIRRNKAAVTIQRHIRGWLKRTRYMRLKRVILGIQTRSRGLLARRKYMELRYNYAATIIGKHVRGWLCRLHYKKQRKHVVVCQNSIRRFLARRTLKKLKMEARSVEHVKKLNKGLENKIISLQQRIEELLKENSSLKQLSQEMNELRVKLDRLRGVENEAKKMSILLSEKERKLSGLLEELDKEKKEKSDIFSEKDLLHKEFDSLKNSWSNEKSSLEKEVSNLKEENELNKINSEKTLQMRLEQEKLLLIKEQEQDKIAYQKLVAEKNYLESQYDNLSQEVNMLKQPGHYRSLSDVSTLSGTEDVHQESGDIGIVLRLQQKIKLLENERSRLHKLIDTKNDYVHETKMEDEFKLQQLEMDNSKLKSDLSSLRKLVSNGNSNNKLAGDELMRQFGVLQEELARVTEESVQLKSVLSSKTQGIKNVAASHYPAADVNMSLINEDGELGLALDIQKKINRQLENELKTNENRWNLEKSELLAELHRLTEDNERQQILLASNISKNPQNQSEAFLKHEILRLTNENLQLHEKKGLLADQVRNLNEQLRELRRRDGIVNEKPNEMQRSMITTTGEKINSAPIVRKKESKPTFTGMFEFREGDDAAIIRHLVHDLKPSVAITLLPGLPAYILFMCIRHTDYINHEGKLRGLLIGYINMVKKVIRRRQNDFETVVLWLSNTLRLLHSLKQYSGDKAFKEENTTTQNEQCLRNFDLSEYRQVISDTAVWIYQGVIRYTEERVQAKAVPALLEHEAISGLSGAMRPRAPSVSEAPRTVQTSLESLLHELTTFHRILVGHAIDPELIVQVFKQLFYFLCASSLNNLLLRKDLCHWSKGMQIRFNLSHLEQWTRDQKLHEHPDILEPLAPIIQASQLLQARKTNEDVVTVCDMCNKMSPQQIIKLLNLYTPADDFEERVPITFIRKISQHLKERTESHDKPLLMDTKFNIPVRFPFNPSNIRLEDIEIPDVLSLPMLKKV